MTTENGSKQRFSLLQEKSKVVKGYGYLGKVRHFNSLKPILFEQRKKTTGNGGVKIVNYNIKVYTKIYQS